MPLPWSAKEDVKVGDSSALIAVGACHGPGSAIGAG
jgi:hypothetical protein